MISDPSDLVMKRSYCILILLAALSQLVLQQADGQPFDYPTASLSTTWIADHNGPHNVSYDSDGSFVKAILLRSNPTAANGPSFACGFYCKGEGANTCNVFLFAIFIVYVNSGGRMTNPIPGVPQVVWSANRDRPVRVGATLELTRDGDLVLREGGSLVWSTRTSGRSVTGISLEPSGNLRLIDGSGAAAWQSFEHPSDVLLSGQLLSGNRTLVANASLLNWTSGEILYLSPFGAYANATPPQNYYVLPVGDTDIKGRQNPCYLRVGNGQVLFVANSTSAGSSTAASPSSPLQFLRFESDGHLRLREWAEGIGWASTVDVFNMYLGDCAYPTVCGRYGICSEGQQRCKCPVPAGNGSIDTYFRPANDSNGFFCQETVPLTCGSPQLHQFLSLSDVSYFNFIDNTFQLQNETTVQECKDACLRNCSCKAAFFQAGLNSSDPYGTCYLPTKLFSLMTNQPSKSHYNSTAFIKIQAGPNSMPEAKNIPIPVAVVVILAVGSVAAVFLFIGVATVWLKRKKKRDENEEDEEVSQFYQLPGMPSRFSYKELTTATEDFTRILGKGGFATVFEGILPDGEKVAVKRLEGVQQISKEFLAEVQIIGRINHVNLVRLVGFCIEKSNRMLLYEYMGNGSLDRWIFNSTKEGRCLSWEVRKKIICQVAKGLLYLHEGCNPKIIHLDIKPQNILLDDDFNAKVSDFGLSKLVERDQSCVMTTMRGTPGYLAPEWLLTSKITDKVDVFSFGVVIVEIVCQRRNFDNCQSEESAHLLKILNNIAVDGQLNDFADRYCPDSQVSEGEAVEMLKLAVWCLQTEADQRPSISMVVKVLEETMDVPDLKFNFLSPANKLGNLYADSSSSTPLLPSILSGPR